MGSVCFMLAVAGVIYLVVNSSGSWGALVKKGVPARGILLSVSSTATRVPGTRNPVIEQRQMQVDVEIPGQQPYEVSATVFVPGNLRNDVMPGATVELRVDPKKRNVIAVVGPGSGFQITGLVTTPPVR